MSKGEFQTREIVHNVCLKITDIIREDPNCKWLSGVLRKNELPPSAVIHCTISGKEYLITIQPTDLP